MTETIYQYSWKQAVADGDLVAVLPHRWPKLSGGKPILATRALYDTFSMAAIMEMWNEFVAWNKDMVTIP